MRSDIVVRPPISKPVLLPQASVLTGYIQSLSSKQVGTSMVVSQLLAKKTLETFNAWSAKPSGRSAIDSFVGDIYSGLQTGQWKPEDAAFAQDHLRILSGLYGILRPLDDIHPYRLEMGYKLPKEPFKNLYKFWGESVAQQIPKSGTIINLTAVEYAKVITPYIDSSRFIAPGFMTVSPKTGEPTFVTVHAKIARGAFANWLIKERATDDTDITTFTDLGYKYNQALSTPERPVFVCKSFGGLGLSVRLKKADQ